MYTTPPIKYSGKKENARKKNHSQYHLGRKGYILKADGDCRTEQSFLMKLTLASVNLQLKVYLISVANAISILEEKILKQKRDVNKLNIRT